MGNWLFKSTAYQFINFIDFLIKFGGISQKVLQRNQ